MKAECEICGGTIYPELGKHYATGTGYRCLACGPEAKEPQATHPMHFEGKYILVPHGHIDALIA
jgi:hypothetical protein